MSLYSSTQYKRSHSRYIQNLKTLAQIGPEKIVTQSFDGDEENGQLKESDIQKLADFLIHGTT